MATVSSGFLDTAYGDTPWEDWDKNQRTYYVPDLLETFQHKSIFYGMVTYGVNLRAFRTATMVFSQIIDPDPNIAELSTRQIWLPQIYMDSRQLEITAAYYGDKLMAHKYDDDITYWRENGSAGLRPLIRKRLGPHMVQSLDLLARNTFLEKATVMYAGSASDFGNIGKTDTFDLDVCRAVQLGADYQPDPVDNPIFAVTSPGAVHTIRDADSGEFVERLKYTSPQRVTLNYEIGMYEGVRLTRHPVLTLWNCGEVLKRSSITSSIALGDGAPDPSTTKVENVWQVGQAGATHYIQVADTTGFQAGDFVSIHVYKEGDSSTYDSGLDSELKATNGCLFTDPTKVEREIYSVPSSTRLAFTKPITTDDFQTDLGSGVYGYVTKARHIHSAVFIKGPRGVVAGVIQPPQTYTPAPIDDVEAIYRVSWDARLKYQQMYPDRFEVYFFNAPVRRLGEVITL
jgi:hypothetical protein